MGVTLRTFVVLICLGLVACGRQSQEPRREQPLAFHFTAQGDGRDPDALLSLALAHEAYLTIQSTMFQRNLASLAKTYPAVFARSNVPDIPTDQLVELMKGASGHFWKVQIRLVGSDDPDNPKYYEASMGAPTHVGAPTRIFLGRRHLARYRDRDLVERSCAINTMAHELAHTVSLTPLLFTAAIEDTRGDSEHIRGREGRSPVASYLVGAVAQCTWLENRGRIPSWAVLECVQVFGVRSFNSLRCNKFGGSAPVQLDAFLPRAANPL